MDVVARAFAARRALTAAYPLQSSGGPPATCGEVFRQGFMRSNILRLAVCSPPRQAETRRYSNVFVSRIDGPAVETAGAEKNVERELEPA